MADEILVQEPKKEDDWMTKKWRPMMAMMYMICCLCDFALFPIMYTIVQFWETEAANDAFRQWVPITLQGGGLFHVAMGAVLGVSAYGRTQEKVAGVANTPTTVGTSSPVLTPTTTSAPISSPITPTVVATAAPAPTVGFNGKAAPPKAPQPEI